jgi:hypothetical protein
MGEPTTRGTRTWKVQRPEGNLLAFTTEAASAEASLYRSRQGGCRDVRTGSPDAAPTARCQEDDTSGFRRRALSDHALSLPGAVDSEETIPLAPGAET